MLLSVLVQATALVASPACQHAWMRVPVSSPLMSAEAAAKAAWLARAAPEWGPPSASSGSVTPASPLGSAEAAAKQAWLEKTRPSWGSPIADPVDSSNFGSPMSPDFVHRPLSYFALENLAAKGSRRSQGSLVDIGEPYDFSRPIATDAQGKAPMFNGARVGSWACTAGGWDSPKLRPTTETFLVVSGRGSVSDADGMVHSFGAGDIVVLPKHWCGRWDIQEDIHKLWVVHDHADVPGASSGIVRAVVSPVGAAAAAQRQRVVEGGLHQAPAHLSQVVYDLGPTRVGAVECSRGSFAVSPRECSEVFFIAAGVCFVSDANGLAQRCVAGDTLVLPQGWSGYWDVVEPVTKMWVQLE